MRIAVLDCCGIQGRTAVHELAGGVSPLEFLDKHLGPRLQ